MLAALTPYSFSKSLSNCVWDTFEISRVAKAIEVGAHSSVVLKPTSTIPAFKTASAANLFLNSIVFKSSANSASCKGVALGFASL